MAMEPLRGVYNILSTPFQEDRSLDEASLLVAPAPSWTRARPRP